MKRFKIGDKVIALTNPQDERCQKRIKGNIYTVSAICYCPKCGEQTINIGQKTVAKEVNCKCGGEFSTKGLSWTRSNLFAYPDELKAELKQAIESEKYEKAAELRDIINVLNPK